MLTILNPPQNPNYNYSPKVIKEVPSDGLTGAFGGMDLTISQIPSGLSTTGVAAANSATQELMNTLGNTVADEGQAEADTAQAQGYQNEVGAYASAEEAYTGVEGAYQTAAEIANQNATLEQAAGDVQAYQEGLQAQQTIGAQRSAVAASGFANSGSALSLLASSNRQASLTQALSRVQTNISVGGYEEQAAAAEGQTAAAQAQGASVGAQAAAASGAANAATAAAKSAAASSTFNAVQSQNYAAQLASLGSYTAADVAASITAGVNPLGTSGGYSPAQAINNPITAPNLTDPSTQNALANQALTSTENMLNNPNTAPNLTNTSAQIALLGQAGKIT